MLKLAGFFSDHMVLQRNKPIRIWGWAEAKAAVDVALGGDRVTVKADADGRWRAALPARAQGRDLELTISSGPDTVTFDDIVVGDVWVCSGQSNMEWTMSACGDRYAADIESSAQFDQVRLCTFPRTAAERPADNIETRWRRCSPMSVRDFSAVAFHMGVSLHRELGVPIGLISTAWGGTAAEVWVSVDALGANRHLAHFARKVADAPPREPDGPHPDPGNLGEMKGWHEPDNEPGAWQSMDLPVMWQQQGLEHNGAIWFRRRFTLPAGWAGRPLKLSLGVIDDFDRTYVDGQQVGSVGAETNQWWATPRLYDLPGSMATPGEHTVAVRVFDQWGGGGLLGPASSMSIGPEGEPPMPLSGAWQYRVELALPMRSPGGNALLPGELYNAMIAPLADLPITGFAWYQGESNANRAAEYRHLLPALIADWRRQWNDPTLPFLVVSLANYTARRDTPGDSTWAELREAQGHTAATVARVGLALAIDVGDAYDIHPSDKLTVGQRLAREALRLAHGRELAPGPRYVSHHIEGEWVTVRFAGVNRSLQVAPGVPPHGGFAVQSASGTWDWAAEFDLRGPDAVAVRAQPGVKPAALRYAWDANPVVSLYDAEMLPAAPFRTDAPE